MKTATKTTQPAALNRADCKVTAARGYQRPDGGIAFSGLLWVRDLPVASFNNDGNGGCCMWDERSQYASLIEEFDALAAREFPTQKFEQRDTLAGLLWDEAYLAS